jgi:D-alanine-D-alanine ligase
MKRVMVITGDHAEPDPTKRGGRYNEEDLDTHQAMMAALRSLDGYRFSFRSSHEGLLEELQAEPPDIVVNFCDTGYRNVPTHELHLPAYMELLGIPYSGAAPTAMVVCYDKAIVRLVAQAHGVPVPAEFFVAADDPFDALPDLYPALLKPNTADGSVGITKDAVVRDAREARRYLAWLRESLPGHDVLWQEYLPGPEYSIGVIGNPASGLLMLPALEVDYSGLPPGLNPILAYESKAIPDSPHWTRIKFRPAALGAATRERLRICVERLYRRLGLRDYGRFDFRVGSDGDIKLMEVNPNPAWANDGKLAFMASFAGIVYRDMLRLILEAAIARTEGG